MSPPQESLSAGLGVRVLDVFGEPAHGGAVAVECECRVGEAVAVRAGDRPLHLATHLKDSGGALLAYDGPRSQPVAGGNGPGRVVVPLAVPAAPGTYLIEIDGVVEGQFWTSSLGIPPVALRVERLPAGDLVCEELSSGSRYQVEARFRIRHPLFGAGETERCVEIPWVLSRYRGERRVVDVGTANAEARYLHGLQALGAQLLVGLDLARARGLKGSPVTADVRRPPLRPGSVDLIFAISVIEHVGRDNSVYLDGTRGPSDRDGDLAAVRALAALLAPGGRLLLTVPFGHPEDHGWFIQYDLPRLRALIAASGLKLAEAEYFRYQGAWSGPHPPEALAGCRYQQGAVAASGLACLALARPARLVDRLARLWPGPR